MMVGVQIGVKTRGFSFGRHLPDQAGSGQVAQTIVDRGAGNPRIAAGERFKNFIRRGMNGLAHQVFEHISPLRRAAQPGALKMLIEF